jgi:hypothetical protein
MNLIRLKPAKGGSLKYSKRSSTAGAFFFYLTVIPGLTRNPEQKYWIPAFAGMTKCDNFFLK